MTIQIGERSVDSLRSGQDDSLIIGLCFMISLAICMTSAHCYHRHVIVSLQHFSFCTVI